MMPKWLSYLYIFGLAVMFAWLLFNQPMTVATGALALIFSLVTLLGIGYAFLYCKDAWHQLRYRQRMQYLLQGRDLADVLEASPYAYGYVFQGDDGYRIWRKDNPENFVHMSASSADAQMWIVERSQSNNLK